MTKNHSTHWIFSGSRAILMMILFSAEVCTSDDANAVALQEAREAREAAERKAVQLEIELGQSRKALDKMRSRYADLYLRSHGLLGSLRQTELQVANLWHNKDASSLDGLAAQLLEALDEAGSRQLDVAKALDEYEGSLKNLLDVLKPSAAMRAELLEKLGRLRETVEKSLRPLTAASGRGSAISVRQGCRVLSVDEALEMVILDGGSIGGMTPESRWCLVNGDKLVAKFIVVDVRLELSAAVLLEGSLADVPVGSVLRPVGNKR